MQDQKPRILLCVSGGIAAYKAIDLASRMTKSAYQVRCVLTENAQKFVSAINFAAITHEKVSSSLWTDEDPIPHITLADWADLIVVAPATANIMAKAAHGIADDLLSSLLLAHSKAVLWVPAMNVNMYANPATRENLDTLCQRGHYLLEPETGMLACGYEGKGKYPPNEEVLYAIRCYLKYGKDLCGKKVLVSAGATAEAIDPMRTITNRSSGKMGLALARALALRGAEVHLVYGSVSSELPYYLKEAVYAASASQMYQAVVQLSTAMDWIIMCAAVSDYTPEQPQLHKIKKGAPLQLNLLPTPDILAELGKVKTPSQKLIGFAAETQDLLANAAAKLKQKNLDLIVVNHLDNAGSDHNTIQMLSATEADTLTPPPLRGDKYDLAQKIIDRISEL